MEFRHGGQYDGGQYDLRLHLWRFHPGSGVTYKHHLTCCLLSHVSKADATPNQPNSGSKTILLNIWHCELHLAGTKTSIDSHEGLGGLVGFIFYSSES